MNKKIFLNKMNFVDDNIASNIYDKMMLAQRTNSIIYTGEFYTPNVWKILKNISEELNIGVYSYGVFEDAERKLIAFSDKPIWHYPVSLIKIKGKSKFNKIEHKDFLGAVMALGIKREKFGDLVLKDDECYMAVQEEMSEYIKMNLTSIGKSHCAVNILDIDSIRVPEYDFESIVVNVASLRIDCVISELCNISRNKAEELIRQGKILVDYSQDFRKNKRLNSDCVITVRGYGKFKIVEEIGCTNSGKIKIFVKKFS